MLLLYDKIERTYRNQKKNNNKPRPLYRHLRHALLDSMVSKFTTIAGNIKGSRGSLQCHVKISRKQKDAVPMSIGEGGTRMQQSLGLIVWVLVSLRIRRSHST